MTATSRESQSPLSREAAERATARIAAFREELEALEAAGLLALDAATKERVRAFHEARIAQWRRDFDVDASLDARRLGWGMKVASFVAALALAAAVFFLCRRFWGHLPTAVQVTFLIAASLGSTLTSLHFAARERYSYFAKLFGLVACVCFGLNIALLGRIFNLAPAPEFFLLLSLFAALLAYACEARLLLAAAVCCLTAWLGARTGTFWGIYWLGFGERPETFFPAALCLFALSLVPHRRLPDFPPSYRIWAALCLFLPMLLLSHWGGGSLMPFAARHIEWFYQIAGFAAAAVVVALGIRRNWPETAQCGVVFFSIFLYTKFFDWCWDWMPKYLFFFLVGLTALLVLIVLRRLRAARQEQAEAPT